MALWGDGLTTNWVGYLVAELIIEIMKPSQLSEEQRQSWRDMRASNPALYSPYFHFEYTDRLGRLHDNVFVLMVLQANKPVAFLPFQGSLKSGGRIGFARPIGAPMTDYHGIICAADQYLNMSEVLSEAGFGAFHFSTLVDSNDLLQSHTRTTTPCTMMDISMGAEQWRADNSSSYRRHLKSNRRRIRKAEELGPRRFEFKCRDEAVFETLIRWKREKFAETGKFDVLSANWTRALLTGLWNKPEHDQNEANQNGELWADMHVLYFGDEIAAIDLGLTDGKVFHSWIVAYNNEHYQLAPGIQLLEGLVDAASNLGYDRIDLGEGQEGYKRHYASQDIQVASGFIAANGPAAALSQIYGAAETFGEKNLGQVGRIPGKIRRRYSQISACENDIGARAQAMMAAVKASAKS